MGRGSQIQRKIAAARSKRAALRRKAEKMKNQDGQKFEGGWVLLNYLQQNRRTRGIYTATALYLTRPETDEPFARAEKIGQDRMATAPGWIEGPALAELPMKEFERGVEYRVVIGPADADGKPRKAMLIRADDTETLEGIASGKTTRAVAAAYGSEGSDVNWSKIKLAEGSVMMEKIEPKGAPLENSDADDGSSSNYADSDSD